MKSVQIFLVLFFSFFSICCCQDSSDDVEYEDFADVESSETTCYFKAALRNCNRGKVLKTYAEKGDNTVGKVTVVSSRAACLIAMCTGSNKKLTISKKIDIGGDGENAEPGAFEKGYSSDYLFRSSSECMKKGTAITTIVCSRAKAPSVGRIEEEYEDKLMEMQDMKNNDNSISDSDGDDDDATKSAFLKMQEDEEEDSDNDQTAQQQQDDGDEDPTNGAYEQEVDVKELEANAQEGTTAKIQWNNWFRGTLHVNCGHKRGLYWAQSGHSIHYKDRIWRFHCKTVSCYNFNHCYWTGYKNYYDGPLLTHCRINYIMTGIYSIYNNHYGDRRFQLLCCRSPRYYTRHCSMSGFVNNWRGWLNYAVQGQRVFTGMYSYHNNGHQDRRWGFADCYYKR